MATFQNINQLPLGDLIQIVFSNGVRNQISEDYRDFEYVSRFRISDSMAREIRFMLQTSFGPAAIQYRNPGARSQFPARQQSTISEHTAKIKEAAATIDVEYNLFDRARKSPERYMLPLALEIQNKSIAGKRRVAADFHADGTGVICEVESAAAYDTANDEQVITLKSSASAHGHVGLAEYGDLLICVQPDGSARGPSGSTNFYAYKVLDKNRESNTIKIQPISSDGSVDTDVSATNIAANDVFYRVGDPALVGVNTSDNSSVTSSLDLSNISDYGSDGFAMVGLDSLATADGRIVNGIPMSGATAATVKTLSNNETIDSKHIQQLLSQVKTRVGSSAYRWKNMTMSPEAHDTLIDSREADRRFQTVDDNKRGVKFFAYVHGNDVLETFASEFCKPSKLYILPEASDGKKVLEFWSTDWETVKGEGLNDWHLNPAASGGYEEAMVSFLKTNLQTICCHPAAIGVLQGFSTI